jgi:hypothetical protein
LGWGDLSLSPNPNLLWLVQEDQVKELNFPKEAAICTVFSQSQVCTGLRDRKKLRWKREAGDCRKEGGNLG